MPHRPDAVLNRAPEEPSSGVEPASRGIRMAESVAGLLSSGLLVATVVLLGAKLVAPSIVDGATGPQWWRIGVMAAVAVPGELARIGRRRRSSGLRMVTAVVVVVAVFGALALTWWW